MVRILSIAVQSVRDSTSLIFSHFKFASG